MKSSVPASYDQFTRAFNRGESVCVANTLGSEPRSRPPRTTTIRPAQVVFLQTLELVKSRGLKWRQYRRGHCVQPYGRPAVLDKPLFFPVDEAESAVIRKGVDYWEGLKGTGRFPERNQVTLRGLRALAKYSSIVRVIEGGRDYEFRFVGDVPVSAVGWNFQGRRMSEPEVASVMQANYRQQFYDLVVESGEPWLFKCRMVDNFGLKLPLRSETVYLPLGFDESAVDHLLGFTVFAADES